MHSRRRFVLLLLASAACRPAADAPQPGAPPSPTTTPLPPGQAEHADLVVRGGVILTMDPAAPRTHALAASDGVVIALGDAALEPGLVGSRTRVVDLAGGSATPGLTDAHAHLVGLGATLQEVDLRGAKSIEECVTRLKAGASASGWITGRGWDQNLWPGKAMPTHDALTKAFPDRVVWVRRVDGHAGWGNAALLKAAGIGKRTKSPKGGEILRGKKGKPTGVLVDAAMGLVDAPAPTQDEIRQHILDGQQHMLERGLTGVHEMGIGPAADKAYRALASATTGERLKVRVHAYAGQDWFARDLGEVAPDPVQPQARYILAGVKMYADGALGSRGAALLKPYSDRAGHRGLMRLERKQLTKLVRRAVAGGWQVATHAIGDAANRQVLDAYAAAIDAEKPKDARLRIEHAQIVHPSDIPRFADLGVIASMQPTHATSDMPWVPERIGPNRLPGAYAWQRFLEAGAHLCFGSDFPVELVDVTHGLYAAITRQDAEGKPAGGWLPGQRVDLDQAIRSFTTEAAYAAHRDEHLGRLATGFRADLTCFASPVDKLSPAELRSAKILGTIVDGEVMHWAG